MFKQFKWPRSQCVNFILFLFITFSLLHFKYSGVCYNERCYNQWMLQWTVFINKIRMLQWTQMLQWMWRNTNGQHSTCACMTCWAFPLWLEYQSSSLLSFVRFIYQFSSVIRLFIQCIKAKLILYYFDTYIFDSVLYFSCLNGCVGW